MDQDGVAITGIGVVSPLGIGYAEFAESVTQGVLGLDVWSGSADDDPVLAGEVVGFEVAPYLVAEKTYLDRAAEFSLAAVKLCLDDAGLERPPADEERSGLVLGTMFGCAGTMAGYTARVSKRGPRFATPILFSHAFVNTPTSLVSIDYRLRGYHTTITSGRASGLHALSTACVALWAGHADAILAGAVEALTPELMAACRAPDGLFGPGGYHTGDDPDAYDPLARDGAVLGEGAAFFLLERLDAAKARGAEVRAVLSLEAADEPHLLISPANGGWAVPAPLGSVCAPKGLYGDALGAAGALAAATGVAALEHNVVPPVRPGPEPLERRREPVAAHGLAAVAVEEPSGEAGRVRLVLARP